LSVAIGANDEEMGVAQVVARVATSRFDRQAESEIGKTFHAKFVELNALRNRLLRLGQLKTKSEKDMEVDIRAYFERLLADLRAHTQKQKGIAIGARRKVYDHILKKINEAKNIGLSVRPSPRNEPSRVMNPDLPIAMQKEIDEMKQEIVRLRVGQVFNETAVRVLITRRLGAIIEDRRAANVTLWANRLKCLPAEEAFEKHVYDAHMQLSRAQEEFQKLNATLENEKMRNIQLVHWKAKNLKTIDELQRQLSQFEGVGDVDIDSLIAKLSAAQDELEDLRDIGATLEIMVERDVLVPLEGLEGIRASLTEARRMGQKEHAEHLQNSALIQKRQRRDAFTQHMHEENVRLQETNSKLMERIMELESQKEQKSAQVKSFMESTLAERGISLRARSRMAGKILRPVVGGGRPARSSFS
jgi:hypothetical protein